MAIEFACPNPDCGKKLEVSEDLAGKKARCPKCKNVTVVPGPSPGSEPTMLGDYKVVRKLGEGGMGAVYEAIQVKLDRKVALKVLPQKFTQDPMFLERFQREAKAAAALSHTNIIQVFDIGEEEGTHFFSMEFVDGESVQDRLDRDGKLPLEEALDIVEQVAKGLQRAHEQSIIHRDIKPDNVMLTSRGEAKLADLGLAKSTDAESGLTQTGSAMGTVYYMAPEQAEDASRADHRSDIYALGITLFHMLTGKRPFSEGSAYNIMFAHVQQELPSPKELGTELPASIEAVIRKMCAKDPGERQQDYEEVLGELGEERKGEGTEDEHPTSKHRPNGVRQRRSSASHQHPTSNVEGRKQKVEGRRQKAEGRRPKTRDPRPETHDPRPKTQDPRPKTQGGRPKTEGAEE